MIRTPYFLVSLALVFSNNLAALTPTHQLPGCEASPPVRQVIEDQLGRKKLDEMKFSERMAWRQQVLEDLIAKNPREFEPYLRLVFAVKNDAPEQFTDLRERFVKMAKENPDDPLALLLAGFVLERNNTPESIRLLESAQSKAPEFPLPAKELAKTYFWGKRADITKLRQNLEIFFSLCPGSPDKEMQFFLGKDPELQPKVAVALRARLEKETDAKPLEDYSTLWGLEFRTHSPAEHDALRAQIARDLDRLRNLHPDGNAEWQAFLVKGTQQSGAPKTAITALEDRLIREYPSSDQASAIVQQRWAETNKEPMDESDTAAWSRYQKEHEKAVMGWIRNYPDDTYLQRYALTRFWRTTQFRRRRESLLLMLICSRSRTLIPLTSGVILKRQNSW